MGRNESVNTCYYSFTHDCCGTEGEFEYYQNKVRCEGSWSSVDDIDTYNSTQQDLMLCNTDDVDISQLAGVYGSMVSGELYNLSADLSSCTCMYVTYECNGTDLATCRGDDVCEDLLDADCWGNYSYINSTMGNGLYTCDQNWTNDTCAMEALEDDWSLTSLLWEPCSVESFIGDVTVVEYISSENLDVTGDECECTYDVRQCSLLADPAATSCSASDCDSGDCYIETVVPCCGHNATNSLANSFDIVTAEYDEWGYPSDNWACTNSGTYELCPDIMNGTRLYTATSKVGWFYDSGIGDISSQCTCLYQFDECNLPTTSPTADPTKAPTPIPTPQPTELDSSEDDGDGAHSLSLLVSIVVIIVSFASVFVVW